MKEIYVESFGDDIATYLIKSRRNSTLKQQQVAWSALKGWMQLDQRRSLSKSDLMRFFIYLKEVKGLAARTITNYRACLAQPVELATGIRLDSQEFKDLDRAIFLINPQKPKRIPTWSLEKVLKLLQSTKYINKSAKPLDLLRKTVFLLSLASANRVSEITAIDASSIRLDELSDELVLPVKPQFLYKNECSGRSPPDIRIKKFLNGPQELCPVNT